MRKAGALLLVAAGLALAGCPEERGYTRQRVPAGRVPAAVAVDPATPPLALPPTAEREPSPPAAPTSGP